MMKELTVLIGWHHELDDNRIKVFEANRLSFQVNNPEVEVITIMNEIKDPKLAWLSTDIGMFEWYAKHSSQHRSKRYLLVEWDCWCNCDLQQYYQKVWDCDVVGPSVRYPGRDYWTWFRSIPKLPEDVRQFATGIVPFTGILLSDNAMKRIAAEILKPEYTELNSELRLATLAAFLGMEPVVNPVSNRSLTWIELNEFDPVIQGLYHPVKKIFPIHENAVK